MTEKTPPRMTATDVKERIREMETNPYVVASGIRRGLGWYVKNMGVHQCGYVLVPPGHPWYGKTDMDLHNVDVHGGVTYSEPDHGSVFWVVGFDTNHATDFWGPPDELTGWSKFRYDSTPREVMVQWDEQMMLAETMTLVDEAFLASS